MERNEEVLLRAILSTLARQTVPPAALMKIVAPQANSQEWVVAYNLCDGSRTQAEIVKEAKVDAGDLSKKLKRWSDEGILIRVTEGRIERPIHVYPIAGGHSNGASK